MKKWQIVTVSVIAALALLVGGGIAFYHYYLVPEYLAPVMEKVKNYVNDDDVLDNLYDQAVRFHDEGVIDENTFEKFIDAYEKHYRDDESFAREILEAKENENSDNSNEKTSVSARYASTKVGIATIQTNDNESGGNSTKRYSEERTSDRIKAEDVVEAEKVIYEKENKTEKKKTSDNVKESAYATLKANMTSDEFKLFLDIMGKMDTNVLASYVDKDSKNLMDKEGLKKYMHSCLSESEYKTIVNMGYKYVYLFIEN